MLRKLKVLALLPALSLAACSMGSDPYTGLQIRMNKASTMANNIAIAAQESLRCAKGMKPAYHDVRIRNETNVEYREDHGGRGSRGSSGRSRVYGGYGTYSGADVRVEAETEARSRGELRCVPIIDLTPARP
jgi:hypothetical protein